MERLQEKYHFLLAVSLFKIRECCYDNCKAMACFSDKEYKAKECEEIFTCIKCKKTYCDQHMPTKHLRKWLDGICEKCKD